MKKQIILLLCLGQSIVNNAYPSIGLYKKIAASFLIGSGALGSSIVVHKKVQNAVARSLGIASISGMAGISLVLLWRTTKMRDIQSQSHSVENIQQNPISEKVNAWVALMQKIAKEIPEAREPLMSDLRNEYRNCCRLRNCYDLYRILQYDQQLLRRTAHAIMREKIKELVEGWYQRCEADAIVFHMKCEIESAVSEELYEEIKKFFNAQSSRFSPILKSSEHKKLCHEIRMQDNWFWLKCINNQSPWLDEIKKTIKGV